MKKIAEPLRVIRKLYSNEKVNILKRTKTVNSKIYKIGIGDVNKPRESLLIKLCPPENIDIEVKTQSIFRDKCKSDLITTPKILDYSTEQGFIIMDYIEGIDFKHLLLSSKPQENNFFKNTIENSAVALSKFHKIFKVSISKRLDLNTPLLNEEITSDRLTTKFSLMECGMNLKTQSYIDYTPWNILINNKKLFLLDFPERECIFTPHLDIARFKFSLNIIKQHPVFRIFNKNWWVLDDLFDIFLKKYCCGMKFKLNKIDYLVIDYFEKEYAKKLQNIYKTNKKYFFESLYLRDFLKRFTK